MNFQMKNKKCETIILTENLEIKYAMSQAVPSEIEKDLASVQKKPHEVIADEIKNIIEKEFTDKLKNPFSLLPIDIKSIEMNAGEQRVVKKEAGRNVANRDTETMKNDSKKISAKITTTIQRGTTSQIKDKLTSEITESNKSGKQKQNIDNTIVQKTTEFGNSLEAENLHLIISEEEYRLLNSDTFNQNCKFALRIANQYKYHKNYIAYRNYPEQNLKGDERGEAKNLSGKMFGNKSKQTKEQEAEDNTLKDLNFLFKFECDTFRNRCVSSLDWNCVNTDLLAATYGEFDLKSDYKDGYLGFWTLKNPDFPERVIKTTSRAMNCRFSQRNPNLIGVGLYDGVVAIYDIRKKGDQPIADSKELDSKHLDAIWEVNWVGKSNANDKGEGLVSISSDGKIIEWSIKKGLESQELKVLNRVINPAIREEQPETINFRYTTGFSLNFVPGDNIIYFVSTEDGTVHKCSKSYREQYLSNYYGHTGPVYKVRCNPFWTDIFLTCSADWTCRVWNSKEDQVSGVLK